MRITGHPLLNKYGPGIELTGLYCNIDPPADPGAGGGGNPPPADPGAGGGNNDTRVVVAPWAGAGEKPWMLGEAGKEQPWHAAIPEAPVRELMTQKAYSNPAVLATAYYNLNKHVSGNDNVVQIPGENATQEQRDNFLNKLGRPVDPTKYDLTEAFKEDVAANPQFKPSARFETFARTFAFKNGLTNAATVEAVREFRKMENEEMIEATERKKAENDAAVEALKGVYGANYDSNLAAGQRVYKALGLDDKTTAAIEKSMGDAPVIDLLCRIGMKSAEPEGFKGSGGGGGNPLHTQEAAAAEITKLNGDPAFQAVYTNKNDPGNKAAVERMSALFAKAGDKAPV